MTCLQAQDDDPHSKGWAEMIRKVYEVDPLVCPRCGGQMKVISFLTDYAVVDRITNHLQLTFVADKPPPPHSAYQEVLMAADLLTVMSPTIGFSWAMMTFIVPPCSSLRVQGSPLNYHSPGSKVTAHPKMGTA